MTQIQFQARGTLDRVLLRTVQTGWAVVYHAHGDVGMPAGAEDADGPHAHGDVGMAPRTVPIAVEIGEKSPQFGVIHGSRVIGPAAGDRWPLASGPHSSVRPPTRTSR